MQYGNITPNQLDADVFEVVFDTILSSAATTVDITSIDGDVDEIYETHAYIVAGSASPTSYLQRYNNDTAANYGSQYLQGEASAITANSGVSDVGIIGATETNGIGNLASFEITSYVKTGTERLSLIGAISDVTGTTATRVRARGAVWSNTLANVNSIQITATQANGLGIGTQITLSRKRKR